MVGFIIPHHQAGYFLGDITSTWDEARKLWMNGLGIPVVRLLSLYISQYVTWGLG